MVDLRVYKVVEKLEEPEWSEMGALIYFSTVVLTTKACTKDDQSII